MPRHSSALPEPGSTTLAAAVRDPDPARPPPKTVPALALTPADDAPSAPAAAAAASARPPASRALSGGTGLLAQSQSMTKSQPTISTPTKDDRAFSHASLSSSPPLPTGEPGSLVNGGDAATTSSASPSASSAAQPVGSLLFSDQAPSPAPYVARTSSPSVAEPQPVPSVLLSTPSSGSTSPRTPPNLRLEIPPQEQIPARDTMRAPFAPDPENEGICTEVGSLGQEIQLESGDHLNALERIYLYTQSKATFHRIFMSRALPTYLKEVTPIEAVEYVLPLLGGLAIDEEERVKETFVAELLIIIWWFFTTCRLTDQELDQAPPPEPDPEAPLSTEPPLVSVQSFSAVLASLLLSNNPNVSAIARGTVVELLGRTRWIVGHPDEAGPQTTQYSESMPPVGEWSVGLVGPTEARMIQLEIIYGVIVDLGRLDLNAEEMGAQGEGQAAMFDEASNVGQVDLTGADESAAAEFMSADYFSSSIVGPESATAETIGSATMETSGSASTDTSGSTTTETSRSGTVSTESSQSSGSAESPGHPTLPASDFAKPGLVSVSDSALTPTPANSKSYTDMVTPRSGSTPVGRLGFVDPGSGAVGLGGNFSGSGGIGVIGNGGSMASSSGSSLNLPELSPGESSSRSSVASPAEPVSPPASRNSFVVPEFKTSTPSTPGTEDLEMSWHSASEGGGLRPGLRRGLSTMSAATSGIDPDDYADAEDWGDGVDFSAVDVNVNPPGLEATANLNEPGAETNADEPLDEATEIGDPLANGEDAYIDDGAAAEEAAIGRVASMSLIAAVTSSGVVDDEIYTLFVEEVMRVSADPVYWVRSETSYALGTLAKAVGEGSVEPYLLPILEALMTDTEAHVRQASVFAIPSVLKRLSPQRRRQVAMQYMLQLCEDEAESVRTGALQVLAEVIHTFREDEGGPPEEFVDFFLKGEHNQAHASLPAPTPPPEDVWGEPSSYFPSEPSFPEPDRALICAFNLPAVAQTLGAARWARLSGYYVYLAEESWHTPKVRSTLAASTGEIARIIGPDAALRDVVPVWWTCVSGGERDAKVKALNALPVLLEALDDRGRAEVAKKMDEAWASGGSLTGWKEREAFAKQLALTARTLSRQGAILCRIFRSGLEDRVAATREAVVAAVPVLHEALEGDKTHTRVARDDLFGLITSGPYRHKTTALVESLKGAWVLKEPRFNRAVAELSTHTVIDVRIGLGRLITSICERHMPERSHRPKWLTECLERLSLDPSSDVRAYVHRAAYAEVLELRQPANMPKPKSKTEDPEFAEFSRPP
ncbi:hypothetical protein RhiJN_17987 [Ceratobasidium sp. AG-Ba]|nr:hypothetical protein RhiJN_17987 [Ceratobasidium sp. AG-Ba]